VKVDPVDPSQGLKRLYEDDDSRGVITEHAAKLQDILARLEPALEATWICPAFGCILSRAR
jgi:hypothetical protein